MINYLTKYKKYKNKYNILKYGGTLISYPNTDITNIFFITCLVVVY